MGSPNVELKFPSDTYDRISLQQTVTVSLNDAQLHVGCLELQIAYKFRLGAQKDFEDALYLTISWSQYLTRLNSNNTHTN